MHERPSSPICSSSFFSLSPPPPLLLLYLFPSSFFTLPVGAEQRAVFRFHLHSRFKCTYVNYFSAASTCLRALASPCDTRRRGGIRVGGRERKKKRKEEARKREERDEETGERVVRPAKSRDRLSISSRSPLPLPLLASDERRERARVITPGCKHFLIKPSRAVAPAFPAVVIGPPDNGTKSVRRYLLDITCGDIATIR